jgi:hypothetical protein
MLVTIGAAMNALTFLVSGATTGPYQITEGKGSNRYGRPATKSSGVFCNYWSGTVEQERRTGIAVRRKTEPAT